jgi:hypothetical protein
VEPEKIETVDASGRKIVISPLDPADVLDLMEAAEDASSNVGFVRYAMVICSVSDLGGVPVPRPRDKNGMKALARKLGNEGFTAVSKALFGGDKPAEDKTVETAKN